MAADDKGDPVRVGRHPFSRCRRYAHKAVFDEDADVYLVVVEGWEDVCRLHGCLVHVEIKGDKTGIQQDGTENGVASELLAAGIPKEHIVLGFKSPQSRALTDFAVA